MRTADVELSRKLSAVLVSFDQNKHHLPGIQSADSMDTFVEQLLESIHRVRYFSVIKNREIDERYISPRETTTFDPVKAAILHHRKGDDDEAFWLVFLLTHFGKHRLSGWYYLREVYGCLGEGRLWDWAKVSSNPTEFRKWLGNHQETLRSSRSHVGFGNHRKYQSLDAYSYTGTGAAVESYVNWVGPTHSHQYIIDQIYEQSTGDPKLAFETLYRSMEAVISFGRTARFDYLTMISHVGLATIEPGHVYLQGATGPLRGARLLFGGNPNAKIEIKKLDALLSELDADLRVGMQVMEDTLCNWQKSPNTFKRFRG